MTSQGNYPSQVDRKSLQVSRRHHAEVTKRSIRSGLSIKALAEYGLDLMCARLDGKKLPPIPWNPKGG